MEIGVNVPAFLIALVITAILAVGIKESARFNSTIVVIKVSVVLFVIGLGFKYVNFANWGHDWSELRADTASPGLALERRTYFSRTSDSTQFRRPRRKRRIRNAICPSESFFRC